MNIIDPHLHLFDLNQGEYHWLKPENPPFWSDKNMINQSFFETDLRLNNGLALAGFVHVEAGYDNQQPWREIAWLEAHCQLPFKSISAIDLSLNSEQFLAAIERIQNFSSVVGVRDILDENALEYLSSEQVKINFQQLAKHQLIFELQMPLENLVAVELLVTILTDNPNLNIIITHAGFPPYTSYTKDEKDHFNKTKDEIFHWENWIQAIEKLSLFEQCTIKCSGFEMISRNYREAWKMEVINTCLSNFGINRVMLASNFPLCLFSKSYQEHWQQSTQSELLTADELHSLCFLNAQRIYKF
jgi:predicted TIM-barrel fold metal-dependent hydrolase